MGMSISSSRASTVMLSQPMSTPSPMVPKMDTSGLQNIKPAAEQSSKLNTEGSLGTLLNTLV